MLSRFFVMWWGTLKNFLLWLDLLHSFLDFFLFSQYVCLSFLQFRLHLCPLFFDSFLIGFQLFYFSFKIVVSFNQIFLTFLWSGKKFFIQVFQIWIFLMSLVVFWLSLLINLFLLEHALKLRADLADFCKDLILNTLELFLHFLREILDFIETIVIKEWVKVT